jgi:hypothetical protein
VGEDRRWAKLKQNDAHMPIYWRDTRRASTALAPTEAPPTWQSFPELLHKSWGSLFFLEGRFETYLLP